MRMTQFAHRLLDVTQLRTPAVPPLGKHLPCPLCGADANRILGVRGNREYTGANAQAEPHLWTNVVRCTACEFVFTNPMLPGTEEAEAAYYNDPVRYQSTERASAATLMFESRLEMIERHHKVGRILDVGAGKGDFLAVARARGWRVEGVEPSPRFCEYAKRELDVTVHNGLLGTVDAIPKHAFDAIAMNHVLEHVDEPRALLSRIREEYLADGGVLFVEVPNVDALLSVIIDAYFRARGRRWSCRLSPLHPPFHRYGYGPQALRFVLEQSGYEVLEMETFSGMERGIGAAHARIDRIAIHAALRALSGLGNRELLCVVARPRA